MGSAGAASFPTVGCTQPLCGYQKGLAMPRIALFLGMAVFLAAVMPAQAAPYAPKVGQRHPDFTLPNIATGKPVALSDFRGKKVLLVHFASW
jgi:hypothetical protein